MTGTEIQVSSSSRQDDWSYAKALATANDQLPRKFRDQPGNILVAMEYARSLNLPLMVGITGVQVIDGVPSVNAQTMQALVRRAGHLMRVAGDDRQAECQIVRRDDPEYTYRVIYTVADAQQAGLLQIQPDGRVRSRTLKGAPTPWEAHTRAMLRARAISECCRMACADVLAGVAYTPEELEPFTTVDAQPFSYADQPQQRPDPAVVDPAGAADPEWPAEASSVAAEPVEEPQPAPTQAGVLTEQWRSQWQTSLDDAAARGDLETIAQLGRDAYAQDQGDLGAQARGVWARVQAHLSQAGQ